MSLFLLVLGAAAPTIGAHAPGAAGLRATAEGSGRSNERNRDVKHLAHSARPAIVIDDCLVHGHDDAYHAPFLRLDYAPAPAHDASGPLHRTGWASLSYQCDAAPQEAGELEQDCDGFWYVPRPRLRRSSYCIVDLPRLRRAGLTHSTISRVRASPYRTP